MIRKFAVLSAMVLCLSGIPMPSTSAFAFTTTAQTQDENDSIITVSVVDYETGKRIETPDDAEWNVTLEAGYPVEFVTPDGKFGWGTEFETLCT